MKKGFTLVEMIGIIVILAVILLVTVPATISTLNNSNQKRYESFKKELKLATENYIVGHGKTSENSVSVSLQILKDKHYIDEIPTIPEDDPFATESGGTDLSSAYVLAEKNMVTKIYNYKLCKNASDCQSLQ